MLSEEQVHTHSLGALGLIAATMDKIGLTQKIDKRLPLANDKGVKVSMGQRVAAMILNGLGFMDDRLYMFPEFLESIPVKRFFGQNVEASHFNDDALGRALDSIHDYGTTKLFSEVAFEIGTNHGLLGKTASFDTTSLTVYGEYLEDTGVDKITTVQDIDKVETQDDASAAVASSNSGDSLATEKPEPFVITHGYSKDGRPDLKQMILNLATTGKSNLPIWMSAHSGNASDKVVLQKAAEKMKLFVDSLVDSPSFLFVGDAAMYEACSAKACEMLWLSRVPHTNLLAKNMLKSRSEDHSWRELPKGYKISSHTVEYKGVKQRWLLVFSTQKYKNEKETLERKIKLEKDLETKKLWHLGNQIFTCSKDAEKAAKPLTKALKYHNLTYVVEEILGHTGAGRPKKTSTKNVTGYKINATINQDEASVSLCASSLGRFILATNQLDEANLSDEEMLFEYKEQMHTEAGFRFIKNDTFEVSSVFLKKPSRVQALMMVMTLCLMIYNLSQYFLRTALVKNNDTIPDQLKKPTQKPTMERVCKMFRSVHVVYIQFDTLVQEFVSNLNDILRKIIRYFGNTAEMIYGLQSLKPEN